MKNLIGHLKSIFGLSQEQIEDPLSFQAIFSRFREVLNNNNRALETITDMGEKLGGEYLFDINYIKSAYSELCAAMHNSIHSFDILTGKKHLQLHDVFNRIDNQIKRMIYDVVSESGENVAFYEDIAWDMSHEVGGKNFNLAEIKNYLKLNIPDAFAITAHAFDEFMSHNRLKEKIDALAASFTPPFNSSISKGGHRGVEIMLRELQDSIIGAEIPPAVDSAINNAVEKIKSRCGRDCFLAVRSSAQEEDGEFSFAGQFETVLNVPLEIKAVKEAYKKVAASLFSEKAVAYQKQLGYDIRNIKMAAGCVVMVDAVSSGVIYSVNPGGDKDTLIINATWGLGASIVEGHTDADLYVVKKDISPRIIEEKIGRKEFMTVNLKEGGISNIETPEDMREKPCLTAGQIIELARQAMSIEKHCRKPQDIECAIDRNGRIFILQARPLRVSEWENPPSPPHPPLTKGGHGGVKGGMGGFFDSKVLMRNKGTVVQKGVGAGKVFIPMRPDDLNNFPKGSILVSKRDSSDFVRIMPFVSAIITDVGTPTSHMAALCREFKVPTIVNAGDATLILKHGQEITVYVDDDDNVIIYDGIVRELLERAAPDFRKMEDIYEFRKKKYFLRYISPLNLIDPLLDNFTPEKCKTMHDILRFIHEKSVAELVDSARYGNAMLKKHAAVKLDISVPAGIIAINIGGGLDITEGSDKATFEQITSIPLRAILKGMMHPGVWHSEAVALKVNDFLSSMMRMPDITADTSEYVGYNVAVVSREYVNLSLRFGYHFNMLDCYCSENARNNHIYFRFVGGATDIIKRSRRIELLATILREYGFNLKIKGDLIIARLANLRQDELVNILDQLGRLIAYTRQLDALLHDDSAVERYAKNFIAGRYEL